MGKTDTSTAASLGGRLWKAAMGLLLVVVGSVFVSYLWGSYQRAATMDDWVETPCRILSSEKIDAGLNQKGLPKFAFSVRYEYEADGQVREGTSYRRLPTEASEPRKIDKLVEDFPAGSETVCHVDPTDPAKAVLKKETKAALYSIWFPCLFVVGGVGMILTALFRRSP